MDRGTHYYEIITLSRGHFWNSVTKYLLIPFKHEQDVTQSQVFRRLLQLTYKYTVKGAAKNCLLYFGIPTFIGGGSGAKNVVYCGEINHNCNTIHIKYRQMQMQADSVVSDTNSLLISWLLSTATQGERHSSYYADPDPNVRHISWCLRSLSVEICKTWLHTSTAEDPNLCLNGTIYQPLRSGRIWHKVNF